MLKAILIVLALSLTGCSGVTLFPDCNDPKVKCAPCTGWEPKEDPCHGRAPDGGVRR